MVQKNGSQRVNRFGFIINIAFWRSLLLGLLFATLGALILSYQAPTNYIVNLQLNDVAPSDIIAPDPISYASAIETKQEQERVKNAIDIFYTPPDPKIARAQVARLRQIFDYLDTVRADEYSLLPQKAAWVRAIPDLSLSDILIDQVLITPDQQWDATKQEALAILDQVMRTEIRESQVNSTRRQLPNRVALDTPEQQTAIIVGITEDLIRPNTFPDLARTTEEQRLATEKVPPVTIQIAKNELIVSAGQLIQPIDLEKLAALGLQQPPYNWLSDLLAPTLLIFLTTSLIAAYLRQYAPHIITDIKRFVLLGVLLLVFLVAAKLIIPHEAIGVYSYPIAALTMLIAVLIDVQLAFFITAILAIWAGYMATENWLRVVLYLILSGWTGALALNKERSVSTLIWAGLYVISVNIFVIFIFALNDTKLDMPINLQAVITAGALNGVFSAGTALIGLISIGQMLDITTTMQLADLARPTHPLLRQLLLNAPGTYHHSLMVSNLAEQAAERIGADALLVRVMAYYHDIGKIQRPYFFVENQPQGVNVHEKLDPKVSAQIIISHVTDGLDLAKKHRLPSAIRAGISQHHGTTLVKFFYYQAVKEANEKGTQVNEDNFHYPGPRPQSKENGILMLADVTESVVRALKPTSVDEIYEIVQKMIAEKLETGQLNQCDLTIADIHKIREAFVDILQGVHHPRIKYPDPVKPTGSVDDKGEQGAAPLPVNNPKKPSPNAPPSLAAPPPPISQPAKLIRRE